VCVCVRERERERERERTRALSLLHACNVVSSSVSYEIPISNLELCICYIHYTETNLINFLFNLLRIKGFYMFRGLLVHPQEALHKRHKARYPLYKRLGGTGPVLGCAITSPPPVFDPRTVRAVASRYTD
jgi:hypothetical protein